MYWTVSLGAIVAAALSFWPADGTAEPTGGSTVDYRQVLALQNVSPERIIGMDEHGIPMVCGTGQARMAQTAGATIATSALPVGTRGWAAIPSVIRADGVDSFNLEVDTNGPVNSVMVNAPSLGFVTPPSPWPVQLRDDGTGEDRVAGDLIFTAGPFRFDLSSPFPLPALYSAGSLSSADPASVAGLWVYEAGIVEIEETDTTITEFLQHPQIGFLDPNIANVDSISVSSDIVITPHLINVQTSDHATQRFLHVSGTSLVPALTQAIYAALPDEFDFFNLFSTEKIEQLPGTSSSNFNAGIHSTVKLDFTGASDPPFDLTALYGSSGRLLGVNALDTGSRGVWTGNATHELMHQWAARVDDSLGLSNGAHYRARSSVGSLVGGQLWSENPDGSFTIECNEGLNGAHNAPPLDLYMMGLIDGSQLPTQRAYDEASLLPLIKCLISQDVLLSELVADIEISDIQVTQGIRTPGPGEAQLDFRIGFVAESHERLLNPTELTYYDRLAEHYTQTVPALEPDPYVGNNSWVPITRFFAEGTKWRAAPEPGGNIMILAGVAGLLGLARLRAARRLATRRRRR